MHNCEGIEQYLSALIDGEASPDEQTELQRHLAVCPTCSDRYRALSALNATVHSALATVPAPNSLRTRISSVIELSKPRIAPAGKRRSLWPFIWTPAGAVAVVLAVLLLRPAGVPLTDLADQVQVSPATTVFVSHQAATRHLVSELSLPVRDISLEPLDMSFAAAGVAGQARCRGAYHVFLTRDGHRVAVMQICGSGRLPEGKSVRRADFRARSVNGSDGCRILFWRERGVIVALCTDLSAERALEAGQLVARQLRSD